MIPIRIVPYDSRWPDRYARERKRILDVCALEILELEHIGSTSIPGLSGRPVIDVMAAVASLDAMTKVAVAAGTIGYAINEAGMSNRLFLVKSARGDEPAFHLHLVEFGTWDRRKERTMRDYLLRNPADCATYSKLKIQAASLFAEAPLEYTKRKTSFIQNIMDKAHDERGWPRIDVWQD